MRALTSPRLPPCLFLPRGLGLLAALTAGLGVSDGFPLCLLPGPPAGPVGSSHGSGSHPAVLEPPPGLCLGLSFPEGPFIPVRGWEWQVLPRDTSAGLPLAVSPSRPPGSPARLCPRVAGRFQRGWCGGTRAFRGPLGPPSSGQCWAHGAVGSRPPPARGACVCVCVSSPTCAVTTDPSTSQEQQGPYHPF